MYIRNRRYDTITPTGLPCHREPSIVLMSMVRPVCKNKLYHFQIYFAKVKINFALMKINFALMKINFALMKINFALMKINFALMKINFALMKIDFALMKINFAKMKTNFALIEICQLYTNENLLIIQKRARQ